MVTVLWGLLVRQQCAVAPAPLTTANSDVTVYWHTQEYHCLLSQVYLTFTYVLYNSVNVYLLVMLLINLWRFYFKFLMSVINTESTAKHKATAMANYPLCHRLYHYTFIQAIVKSFIILSAIPVVSDAAVTQLRAGNMTTKCCTCLKSFQPCWQKPRSPHTVMCVNLKHESL